MYKAFLIITKAPLKPKTSHVTFPFPPCVGQFIEDRDSLLTIKRVVWTEPDIHDMNNVMQLQVEAGD